MSLNTAFIVSRSTSCWFRMEGWRDGGMEGWRDGGTEGWRDGGMEGWRDGGMEGRRDGGMACTVFHGSVDTLCLHHVRTQYDYIQTRYGEGNTHRQFGGGNALHILEIDVSFVRHYTCAEMLV